MTIATGEQITAADVLALISDAVYGTGWDGVTGIAPSKNAVYDKVATVDAAITALITETYYASDTLRNSSDTAKQATTTAPVKVKETKLNAPLPYCRIKFEAYGVDINCRAQIYKNGVAIGTLQTCPASWTTFTEDFSGFTTNDLIQIYVSRLGSDGQTTIQNFRLYYDRHITALKSLTLATPLPVTTGLPISVTNQDP